MHDDAIHPGTAGRSPQQSRDVRHPIACGDALDALDNGDGLSWLDVVIAGHAYDAAGALDALDADSGIRREFVLRHFGDAVRSDRVGGAAGVSRCRHPRSGPGALAADCAGCRAVEAALVGAL